MYVSLKKISIIIIIIIFIIFIIFIITIWNFIYMFFIVLKVCYWWWVHCIWGDQISYKMGSSWSYQLQQI